MGYFNGNNLTSFQTICTSQLTITVWAPAGAQTVINILQAALASVTMFKYLLTHYVHLSIVFIIDFKHKFIC